MSIGKGDLKVFVVAISFGVGFCLLCFPLGCTPQLAPFVVFFVCRDFVWVTSNSLLDGVEGGAIVTCSLRLFSSCLIFELDIKGVLSASGFSGRPF